MTYDLVILRDLLARTQAATGPDCEIDLSFARLEGWTFLKMKGDAKPYWRKPVKPAANGRISRSEYPTVTSSIAAAVALFERALPGWWWKCGMCSVSDDACVAPDYNSPIHGARLRLEFPIIKFGSEFDGGFDVDRRPPGNVQLALIEAMLTALIVIEEGNAA